MNNNLHSRRHPVHLPNVQRYNEPVLLFLTVCTVDRQPLLANEPAHRLLIESWRSAHQWRVGKYVIMPDHLHLFCSPATSDAERVSDWAAYWKRMVSRALQGQGALKEMGAVARAPPGGKLWQRDCWDVQLRSAAHYHERWEYVRMNPVRRGLVGRAEDWPYQGEVSVLWW